MSDVVIVPITHGKHKGLLTRVDFKYKSLVEGNKLYIMHKKGQKMYIGIHLPNSPGQIGNKLTPLHRLIMHHEFGPSGRYIKHINGDGLDNRLINLKYQDVSI